MASVAGTLGGFGQASYSTTKAGLLGLTRTLALEGAARDHRNAIVPGIIGTEAFDFGNPDERAHGQADGDAAPGEPQDVANAIAFLCSDLAGVRHRRRAERERRHRAVHVLIRRRDRLSFELTDEQRDCKRWLTSSRSASCGRSPASATSARTLPSSRLEATLVGLTSTPSRAEYGGGAVTLHRA